MNSGRKDVLPAISVIMATYNCSSCLPDALESIRHQKGVQFECIVVDGGSTDGTVEVIQSYNDTISHWISEKDVGIADAFNKGVKLSSGDLIYFLGSDDVLYDNHVLSDIVDELPRLNKPYFFYGDLYYSYGETKKLIKKNFSYRKFKKYNCIPHQAMFLGKEFFQAYGLFDSQYKYAMDYEHISRFIDQYKPQYVNRVVAVMERFGRSSAVLAAHEEMDRIRLEKGFASGRQIKFGQLTLKMKMSLANLLGLSW